MDNLEPRRVPADTNEITYTGRRGEQVSIEIEKKGRYAYASPASAGDVAALDALGYTTVARKAQDAADDQPGTPADPPAGGSNTPAAGGKES